jgi:capsular polysaccharide transport system permease protein
MHAIPAVPPRRGKPLAQHLRVIVALVLREMGSSFGRSEGGYLWAILQPLGGILMLAVVFSLALRTPPLGTSFMLFYASGMIPFSTYKTMSKATSAAISSNRGLLTYPVVTALDAVLAKFLLNLMTQVVIGVILFVGIIQVVDVHVNLDLGAASLAMLLAALLGLGVGTLNCVLFGFFPTWKNVWSVATRPLLFVSGVLHTFEAAPPTLQKILWWNPIVHIVGEMRAGFYGTYDTSYVSIPYVLVVALSTFVIGAYLLRRHATALIEQ